jgi:RNA polymerase sigma-70 factor, ECF subfamily
MPTFNELETIEKAKAGDQRAFRMLVESFQGFVYSIAFRFVGNEAEAEDLVQECFVRCWKNIKRFNPDYKLKTWLGKMITNLCLDFLKSARARNEKGRVDLEAQSPPGDTAFESELHAAELLAIVTKMAVQLTPKQRAAFILRDLEMLDVKEVCDMLGMSAGTLKSNLYYARLAIREQLLKYYKLDSYEMSGL